LVVVIPTGVLGTVTVLEELSDPPPPPPQAETRVVAAMAIVCLIETFMLLLPYDF